MRSSILIIKEELVKEIKWPKHRTIYLFSVILIPVIAIFLLSVTALIPREAIQQHMEESAVCLTKHDINKYQIIANLNSTTIDQAADANSLNIAYYMDPELPIHSALTCRWRLSENEYIYSFLEAVTEGKPSNTNYSRYWHGYLVFVRPLLVFFNLEQLYVINYIAVFGTLAFLTYMLIKHYLHKEVFALLLCLVDVNLWVVPHCLEYTWMFLVTFMVSSIAVYLAFKGRYSWFGVLFFITGMIVIFLDFFTTETLTITVPLLLVLRIRNKQCKESLAFIIKCVILWGLGYCFMWAAKWALATIMLGKNGLYTIVRSMYDHVKLPPNMNYIKFICEIFEKNISCLLPFDFGVIPSVLFGAGLVFVVAIMKWKNMICIKKNSDDIKNYIILGLVPYFRFFVLPHHSWAHYFFTYRGQAATVMALTFIVMEFIELRPISRKVVIRNEGI